MKNLKNYLAIALIGASFTSCIVDDEINPETENFNGSKIVGFNQTIAPANFIQEANAVFDYEIGVHLLGGASGQPSNSTITVGYELGTLDDVNLTSTELEKFNTMLDPNNTPMDDSDDVRKFPLAVEGTHFDFASATPELTIPENGTFDKINLNVYNDALDAGAVTLLVLKLTTVTTVDNVVVSEQSKAVLVQLQLCRVDLVGSYYVAFASGNTPSTVTELEPGLYRSSYLAPFASTYSFDFTACAGELTIVGWQFNENNSSGGSYYMTQSAPGTVNANGDLVFTGVNMTDISWYVDRSFTYVKN